MVTGGEMAPKSVENFETACVIDEKLVLHPFAFRTHTHNHGVAVSGWKVGALGLAWNIKKLSLRLKFLLMTEDWV